MFTEDQWCDLSVSEPVPLEKADLTKPWIYLRGAGIMYCGGGQHTMQMAKMFTYLKGFERTDEAGRIHQIPGYRTHETLAELFMKDIPGTAFKSSVGDSIWVGQLDNLNSQERRAFRAYNLQEL